MSEEDVSIRSRRKILAKVGVGMAARGKFLVETTSLENASKKVEKEKQKIVKMRN